MIENRYFPYTLSDLLVPRFEFKPDIFPPKQIKADRKNGAFIVYWKNGSKTVLLKDKDDIWDNQKAFLIAYFQRESGLTKTQANKFLDNLEVEE